MRDEKDEREATSLFKEHIPSMMEAHSHRLLLHQKALGKVAMVRQLKSYIHVEYDISDYAALQPFVPALIFFDPIFGPSKDKLSISSISDIFSLTFQ